MSNEQNEKHDNLVAFLLYHTATPPEPEAESPRFGRYDVFECGEGSVLYEPSVIIRPENLRIGKGSRVDSFVKLECGTGMTIGNFVHIASFAHIGIGGGEVELGDFSAVASGGKIISGSNQVDADSMSAVAPAELQRTTKSKTTLEEYACVLTGGIVLPGVTLHRGAVLAAGGVATRDIPPWEIWGGVPAKHLAFRKTGKKLS